MKRRLISQRDSFTLTLPKDWVASQNLKAGDEINLERSEEALVISASETEGKKEYNLDVTNLLDSCIRNTLNGLYILSATKITIDSEKPSKLLLCKKLTTLFLVGFEVTEEKKNQIVLEALAIPSANNFDKFFLKLFNFLEFDFETLKEDKKFDQLEEIRRDTKKVTQYSNICNRILLNTLMNNPEKAVLLEMISYMREINHLIFHIFENKIKVTKQEAEIIREMFLGIRKGYFKKDLSKLDTVQKEFSKYSKDLEKTPHIFAISRNLYGFSNSVLKLIF